MSPSGGAPPARPPEVGPKPAEPPVDTAADEGSRPAPTAAGSVKALASQRKCPALAPSVGSSRSMSRSSSSAETEGPSACGAGRPRPRLERTVDLPDPANAAPALVAAAFAGSGTRKASRAQSRVCHGRRWDGDRNVDSSPTRTSARTLPASARFASRPHSSGDCPSSPGRRRHTSGSAAAASARSTRAMSLASSQASQCSARGLTWYSAHRQSTPPRPPPS
mmetsp:Transcript_824/g.1784  ORF Transcript_824/g.1784 Transcript_824/m.1784 type:complete len:222 (-) Transcript_824:74-739(-)